MKFFIFFHKPPLVTAVEKGFTDIVKLLLTNKKLEINKLYVFYKWIYTILSNIFECCLKTLLILFEQFYFYGILKLTFLIQFQLYFFNSIPIKIFNSVLIQIFELYLIKYF